MTIAVLIITIFALLFAIAAIVFFKLKAPTAGAVFAILALFFTLADVKAFQFRKMGASPMTMPPTTVSSAVVKEEDWAPTLSAVGSISAVQGAIVSTELGGIVSEVGFQSGGEAKKGEVLLKLDSSSEEALLHTAEADLELARANLSASGILLRAKSFPNRSWMRPNQRSGRNKAQSITCARSLPRNKCARRSMGSLAFARSTSDR